MAVGKQQWISQSVMLVLLTLSRLGENDKTHPASAQASGTRQAG
jgi:hypothetical protein